MKLEHFEKILTEYRKSHTMIGELYDIGFDLMEGKYKLDESIYNLFIASLETHYTEDGIDWVTWFIFENEWGENEWGGLVIDDKTFKHIERKYPANDENGNPICYDIPSLWEYIETEHKL